MASKRISDMTAYTTPQPTDVVPIVDVTNSANKKIQVSVLTAAALTPTGGLTLPANYSEIVVRSFTVASGQVISLGSGSRFRII